MTPTIKNALMATLTAAAMSMSAPTAFAQGGMNALASFEAGKTTEQVQFRGRGRGFRGRSFGGGRSFRGGGRSFRGGRNNFRGGRNFRGRGNRGRNIGIGIASGLFVGSLIHSSRYNRGYHSGGHSSRGNLGIRRHVAWCAKRYKTYNARTDTFISYRHGKKRCNSPYT